MPILRSIPGLILTLFASLTSCREAVVPVGRLQLEARLERTVFEFDQITPGRVLERPLATDGWYEGVVTEGSRDWLQSAGLRSTLQLPASRVDFPTLELAVSKPPFLPYEFSLGVELNGYRWETAAVGNLEHLLTFAIPPDLLRVGENELVLYSSHFMSPRECSVGSSARKVGVHLGHVQLLRTEDDELNGPSTPPLTGSLLSVRVPAPGSLHMGGNERPLWVLIQDGSTGVQVGPVMIEGDGQVDLVDFIGRDVSISVWSEPGESCVPDYLWLETQTPLANAVVIVVDTLRFDAVSKQQTPAIWSLAEEGVFFQNSFSHAPMTLPSHTALFSSRYPHDTGVVTNGQAVPEDVSLLAEWLDRMGYDTRATASLATLWEQIPNLGLDQGFHDFRHPERDYSDGEASALLLKSQLASRPIDRAGPLFLFAHFADPHEPYRTFQGTRASLKVQLNRQVVATADPQTAPHIRAHFDLPAGVHEIELRSDAAPFVMRSLYVNVFENGQPVRAKVTYSEGNRLDTLGVLRATFTLERPSKGTIETWVCDHPSQKDAANRYLEEVRQADKAVGGILQSLKDSGLYENSLIVFTSDHGEAFAEHDLNGHSQNLYDELLHVPTIVKLPKGESYADMQRGLIERKSSLIRHVDLAPTILEVLGISVLPGAVGSSLVGGSPEDHLLIAETHQPEAKRGSYCVRDTNFKLIYYPEADEFEMFQIDSDFNEVLNVFSTHEQKRREWPQLLRNLAGTWERRDEEPRETPPAPHIEALGY